jgi:hypothetical protein
LDPPILFDFFLIVKLILQILLLYILLSLSFFLNIESKAGCKFGHY